MATATPNNVPVSEVTLILVNFVVAGLEIASSVAFTFIPPLLLKSGYSETQMSIIFGVGKPFIFKIIYLQFGADCHFDRFSYFSNGI